VSMSWARQVRGGVFNRTGALAGEHCQQHRGLRKVSGSLFLRDCVYE